MNFEQWADRTFGSEFKEEETLTYFRMNAACEAAVLAEREACAKVCENLYKHLNYDADCQKLWPHTKMINDQYAAAIRARGNNK